MHPGAGRGTGEALPSIAARPASVIGLKSDKPVSYTHLDVYKRQVLDDALAPAFAETGFDLIVSNPPYLSEEDMGRLQKEVSFEPREALEAGKDGLAFYRELTRIWTPRLKAGGILAYEVGIHQKEDVCSLLEAGGLDVIGTRRDLCGVERVVYGMKPLSLIHIYG